MAITLEEAKKNVQDDLQMGVIDEFQKSNYILEHIQFDDAVSPTGGGATPSYSYTRLKTQPTAAFREINKEYAPSEVTKERHTVEIKVFGGAYEIDRVIANMGGIVSEVELQHRKSKQLRHFSMIPLSMVIQGLIPNALTDWIRHLQEALQNTMQME